MMRLKTFLAGVAILALFMGAKSDRPAYRIFNGQGKTSDYTRMMKALGDADVVFFGEIHTDPICHWLELQVLKDLYAAKNGKLVTGAEMFERDNQLLLNEYISGMIRKKDFEAEAKLWPNYKTDYAPLVDFAAKKGMKFVGTNIPRRFAAIVNLKGFAGLDSINAVERGMIAPLPLKYNPELDCYKKIGEMVAGSPMHMGDNLPKAQAIKDATMAHSILKNLGGEGFTFYHINGSYHSENREGIVWYLKEYNKRNATELKIVTILAVEQDDLDELEKENLGKADFIICIPGDMIKTQESSPAAISMPPAGAMAPGAMKPAVPDSAKKKEAPQPGADGDDDDD
jgi:uncharacterized iron-regulated protein